MDEEFLSGQSSIQDHQQENKIQYHKQNQNDQFVFTQDRSLNLHNSIKMVLISNDEKYLATLGRWRIIRIYYLKSKKLIKIMKLDDQYICIVIMKFSNNSRNLLFGDTKGYLGCYDINNNCKLIYNDMVHSKGVDNILQIDDDQILTSAYDRSFIITNIKQNQQLLKIEDAHDDWIAGFEFDKSNDFIISCSYDWSIKFFNRIDGKLKIEQQNAHQILTVVSMIQLIQKDNDLLSTNNQQLILWQIDYLNLKLIKLKEFISTIYNFTSVYNNDKIIVICDNLIQILDKDLIVVQSINHNLKKIKVLNKTRQLDSLNYVLIQTQDTFLVLKKVRKLKN